MSEEAEAEILAEIANVAENGLKAAEETNVDNVNSEEQFEDPGTPLGDEYQPPEESDDEDDIRITIGDLKSNVTTFRPQAANAAGGQKSGGVVSGAIGKQTHKLDLDAVAEINGNALFDIALSLATGTDESPWRKPGADITDYFNYGFNEQTWVTYCERQQKLRAEYGSSAAANRALFASLTGTAPAGVAYSDQKNIQKIGSNQSDVAASIVSKMLSLPLIMRTRLTMPSNADQAAANHQQAMMLTSALPAGHMPGDQQINTLPQSVPSLASNLQMSQSALQNLTSAAHLQLSSSPPVSPGMTPPLDDYDRESPHDHMTSSAAADDVNVPLTTGPPMTAGAPGGVMSATAPPGTDSMMFPNLTMPPPHLPNTNMPPPGFHTGMMPGVPGMPPTNVPPPMFPPGALPHPPGVQMRFPPPFGFPPPNVGQRLPPSFIRDPFSGYNRLPRDEARSPASYSDKSSDDERRDRRRMGGGGGGGGGDYHRRSPSRGYTMISSSRDRSSRSSRRRSRSRDKDRRKRSRSRDRKHRRDDDDEKSGKKHKIKEEPIDGDEMAQKESSKKSTKSDHKEKSSSSKKKRKKDKHADSDADSD